ncbi:MAG: serine hydroxymethyltransferase [Candidatus Thermoplasmatota archaeon]|nr:serine hydroxymethyltransferase [Candidatus Thermoplasmatota archaeon]
MKSISSLVSNHNEYRRNCLNLQASENIMSKKALEALSSDLSGRYSHIGENGINDYGGTSIFEEIHQRTIEAAKSLFGVKLAEVSPVGGHIAAIAVLRSTVMPGQKMLHISTENGGYPGYDSPYIPKLLGVEEGTIPYNFAEQEIDYEALETMVKSERPALIVLGQSAFVREYDLKRIRDICEDSSSGLVYDGSHVMGLIAGRAFQKDVMRFCSILFGSTHKTFPGPQGGIILANDPDMLEGMKEGFTWHIQDNTHLARIAALGVTLEEMKEYAGEYASRVVRNSGKLGAELSERGFGVRFKPWFSHSHQLLIDDGWLNRKEITRVELSSKLERNNIIVDRDGRIGTSEISRLGYEDMSRISELIMASLRGEDVKGTVTKIASALYGDFK